MFKPFSFVSTFSLLMLSCAFAQDEGSLLRDSQSQVSEQPQQQVVQAEKPLPRKSPIVKAAFAPFTGKVSGSKVRVRLQPDLAGHIICEFNKGTLVSVVNEEGEFYSILPPDGTKAYVFRSFVLDDVVEGNRVNVRLEPDLDSPVIGHLNSGDRVQGKVCASNQKWLEIVPPNNSRFYVSKEFIDAIGNLDYKAQVDKRKDSLSQAFHAVSLKTQEILNLPFEQIDFEQVKASYAKLMSDYADFPEHVEKAKDLLAKIQEKYTQKQIAYLEGKTLLTSSSAPLREAFAAEFQTPTQKMHLWESVEEFLYTAWTAENNEERSLSDYYQEQQLASVTLTGTLEAYSSPIKNKPGDFILKNKNLPLAYIYSTKVNLHDYVGKKVTLKASPRPNHNFAFPAYFVHEVQ